MDDISSSAFIPPTDFSAEWSNITPAHQHSHTLVYTATRYGRRYLLKAIAPKYASLTDHMMQQEQEFQFGVQLVHPNIAATYSLETVKGIGRCIVQEWIDGTTLGEWLQTTPTTYSRMRVLEQLMDALEYIHGLQLVHRDLKCDNILITRNGNNVKLIDFGLSATDATVSPVSNDQQVDIKALGRLMPLLHLPLYAAVGKRCRKGKYNNIAALRKAIALRQKLYNLFPLLISIVLFVIALSFFYFTVEKRNEEKRQWQEIYTTVETHIAQERELIVQLIEKQDALDKQNPNYLLEHAAIINGFTEMRKSRWAIRDSLMQRYAEDDPRRQTLWQLWVKREAELDNELYKQLLD